MERLKSGTKRGVASIYPRHEYADESRAALEAWGRYMGQLVSGSDADDMVPMCRRPPVGAQKSRRPLWR
jgi:hypothetical protein